MPAEIIEVSFGESLASLKQDINCHFKHNDVEAVIDIPDAFDLEVSREEE